MSSLTTEQYGIIGGITALMVLIKQWGNPTCIPTITIWVDNKDALTWATNWNTPLIQLKEYGVSDYTVK